MSPLTYKNKCKQNAHPYVRIEPQDQVCHFRIHETRCQIIYHRHAAGLPRPYHDNDHEEKENLRFPLKVQVFINDITERYSNRIADRLVPLTPSSSHSS